MVKRTKGAKRSKNVKELAGAKGGKAAWKGVSAKARSLRMKKLAKQRVIWTSSASAPQPQPLEDHHP